MISARDLNRSEVKAILSQDTTLRNKALLVVGFNTGFRISEMLSLTIKDVFNGKTVRSHVTVAANNMKNKKSRTIRLNSDAVKILTLWCKELAKQGYTSDSPLFISREKTRMSVLINGVAKMCEVAKAITRCQANNILKELAELAGVDTTRVSSHSFRKTFAKGIYIASGRDLTKVQYALGHSSITITIKYLMFAISEIDSLVEGLSYE
jgi:site-specific recombinase XerD